jgi:hypothetical protein
MRLVGAQTELHVQCHHAQGSVAVKCQREWRVDDRDRTGQCLTFSKPSNGKVLQQRAALCQQRCRCRNLQHGERIKLKRQGSQNGSDRGSQHAYYVHYGEKCCVYLFFSPLKFFNFAGWHERIVKYSRGVYRFAARRAGGCLFLFFKFVGAHQIR